MSYQQIVSKNGKSKEIEEDSASSEIEYDVCEDRSENKLLVNNKHNKVTFKQQKKVFQYKILKTFSVFAVSLVMVRFTTILYKCPGHFQ